MEKRRKRFEVSTVFFVCIERTMLALLLYGEFAIDLAIRGEQGVHGSVQATNRSNKLRA